MKYVASFLLLFFVQNLLAQEVLENNPPRIKWNKIKTPNFRVLYPAGFEDQAQRIANTLEYIRIPEARTLGKSPRKISVILQNQTSITNGFVSITPRRSEFFTMPPQDNSFSGTTEWLNQLAAHEYRHVVQFDRARTGFNKFIYYLFGHATLAGMAQVSAPMWFWEGDAVAVETAFTHSGRGRIPNFGLVLKTNLMEGREFNYHKQYLRSYKHNISDHYVLGYHLVGYLRKRTNDPMIWDKVTNRSWNVPFIPFAFSNALKKETGLYVTDLYEEMVKDLKTQWEKEIGQLALTSFEPIHMPNRRGYTDYRYPQVLGDGRVIAMKRGIGEIEQFVVVAGSQEKKIFTPGFVNDNGMLSAAGSKIVWNEYGFDPRWRRKTYSLIKVFDSATKQLSVVSSESRYAGAALSPDGQQIVTVESAIDYTTSLLILDLNGNIVKKLATSKTVFYSMPRWADDGNRIVTLKTTPSGRSVSLFDITSGTEQEIIPASHENIGHPVMFGDHLFFNSPVSGIDNIYAFDLQSKQRYQVTASKYGAYNPVVTRDGKAIYYNEQTREGFDIVKVSLDAASWKSFEPMILQESYDTYLTEQEGRPNLFDSIPQQKYATGKYNKLSGIVNPYSWGVFFNPSLTQADIGITSQDILSTTLIKAGYLYDIYEQTGAWRAGISYQNWFPIIDVDFRFANRSVNEGNITYDKVVGSDTTYNVTENLSFDWTEKTFLAGIRIPLLTTSSRYRGNFTLSNYVGHTLVTDFINSIDGGGRVLPTNYPQYFFRDYQDNGLLLYNQFSLSAYRLLKQSRRDINSKWGQVLFMNIFGTPYGGDFSGKQFSFYSLLYFPGFFKHHSLWGYWAFQSADIPQASANGQGLDNYLFSNQIPLPRGMAVGRFQKFYSMSANYTLPIWYPDVAMGPLVNIQRLRGNAFLDYGFGNSQFGQNPAFSETYVSIGGELKIDINILRFLPQLDIGFRYSYGIQPTRVSKFEFLLGTINF